MYAIRSYYEIMSPDPRHIRLKVPMVTRLEGEGALELYAHDNQLEQVQLRIYEPRNNFV